MPSVLVPILMLVLIALLLLLIALLVYILFGLYITAQGPPFAPSSDERVEHILQLARVRPGKRVADLGSGDGRVLIALASAGVRADGYEINPWLVWRSRRAVRRAGLEDSIAIHCASFWKANLGRYDLVVIYGIGYIMENLAAKLERELKDGSKVISVYFEFPEWQPKKVLGDVRLYQV